MIDEMTKLSEKLVTIQVKCNSMHKRKRTMRRNAERLGLGLAYKCVQMFSKGY